MSEEEKRIREILAHLALRKSTIKSLLDSGDKINISKRKELAITFNCSLSTIHSAIYAIKNPYYYKNKKSHLTSGQNSRARKLGVPGILDENEWIALCEKYGNICLRCRQKTALSIDHVMPMSRGGDNTIDNVQPLCRYCNMSKNDTYADYRTGEQPMPTKHHILRLDDERWQRLQELAKQVVTTDRPARARPDSTWQVTELLRLLADGKLKITPVENDNKLKQNVGQSSDSDY